MKYYIFIASLLFSILVYSQEKTISLSELDSITSKNNSKSFGIIENAPTYKGCNRKISSYEKKNCMSQKISELFHDNFNTELHPESDLNPGMKHIDVIFKIDTDGNVIDIDAKAKDEYLENEAIRVAKLIPQMTPGMQRGKPVVVPYTLPLTVNVTARNKNDDKTRYPVYRGCDKKPNNAELEACSRRKITNFIKMSFDVEMASRALPLAKSTQFLLEFTINKKGKIENINAKANHKAIAIEAINVAKRLPKFKAPGLREGVPVNTPYRLLMTLDFY